MADIQAWKDRDAMINLFANLGSYIENFIAYAEKMEKFKLDVLDDIERWADMKKLIDEDPNWNLLKIQSKYNEFKTIYDYLTQ